MVLKNLFENPRVHTTINYHENPEKEKVFERRLDEDVKDVVDDELVAVQSQIKSMDEEYIQVQMYRDGLMNRANFLMSEKSVPGVARKGKS